MFKLESIKIIQAVPQPAKGKVDPCVRKSGHGGGTNAQLATLLTLALAVTVDTIAGVWVWEAECPYSWLGGPTAGTWVNYGVAGTSIRQPASITAIQAAELPSSKELAHRSDLCTILLAGIPGLRQCQLLRVLQVVHPPCGRESGVLECYSAEEAAVPATGWEELPYGGLIGHWGGAPFWVSSRHFCIGRLHSEWAPT